MAGAGHHGPVIVARIERETGIDGLVELLADRISPADLQSLLLAVRERQAARLTPPMVLRRYRQSRFSVPSPTDPLATAEFEHRAFGVLSDRGYAGVELSPVCPLGTVSALGTVHQNKVLATDRHTEVVADSTNSLALEAAIRRRGARGPWVRLYASHRLLRAQMFDKPYLPHFRLLALVTAGRDEGSYRFEVATLLEQLDALLAVSEHPTVRVALTDLTDGARRPLWQEHVVEPLRTRYPSAEIGFDDARTGGRNYYVDACFKIYVRLPDGQELEVGDGGFTTWTRDLLSDAKERLLTGCVSIERLIAAHRP